MARVISGDGYWMITPPIGYKGKTYIEGRYVFEHRLIMQRKVGRLLKREEVVDHINGDKLDNREENLQILTPVAHNKKHYIYKGDNVWCKVCGKGWHVRPWIFKNRKMSFCSREHFRQFVKSNGSIGGKGNILKAKKITLKCLFCGKDKTLWEREYRLRIKKNKSKGIFCSRSCGTKFFRRYSGVPE